jgi:hypothetical protein
MIMFFGKLAPTRVHAFPKLILSGSHSFLFWGKALDCSSEGGLILSDLLGYLFLGDRLPPLIVEPEFGFRGWAVSCLGAGVRVRVRVGSWPWSAVVYYY